MLAIVDQCKNWMIAVFRGRFEDILGSREAAKGAKKSTAKAKSHENA